jgi:hypothetical protein
MLNPNIVVDATNVTDYIMAYEEGSITDEHYIALFQYLLDSGLAWKLQGSYGRTTMDLLNNGYLIKRKVW